MKKNILPFKWQEEFLDIEKNSIGNDVILIDKPLISAAFDHPFKIDVTTAIICLKGTTKGMINLKTYETSSPGLIIILPNQILEYEYISEDFSALFIIMSSRFTESLNIEERLPTFLSIQKSPVINVNQDELDALIGYYKMMQRAIAARENPYQLEIARNLTRAFFYGFGYNAHIRQLKAEEKMHRKQAAVEKFLALVQEHHRTERSIDFYAGKLFLTPKYLSKIVKENSGNSAGEWIENYVITEAKALLKSTDMTIQQISDSMNFPSQSFFGKYFKRIEGVSPREYKNNQI
ncbi:MAG: helix-turn-helix domain-containing protein [Agriterribacter sp.]